MTQYKPVQFDVISFDSNTRSGIILPSTYNRSDGFPMTYNIILPVHLNKDEDSVHAFSFYNSKFPLEFDHLSTVGIDKVLSEYKITRNNTLDVLEEDDLILDRSLLEDAIMHVDAWISNVIINEARLMFDQHNRMQAIEFIKNICNKYDFLYYTVWECMCNLCDILSMDRFYNHKAKIIQRAFKEAICNPNHVFCRRRLYREFQNMEQELIA